MKHKLFIIRKSILLSLLLCVLIPLQEATATVTREMVGGTTRITDTDDTHDIVFTIRFTIEEEDNVSISAFMISGSTSVVSDPESLDKDTAGTYDMTMTIPRSLFSSKSNYTFNILGGDTGPAKSNFVETVTIIVTAPGEDIIETDLKIVGIEIGPIEQAKFRR